MKDRGDGGIVVDARGDGETWITVDRPRKHNALARATLTALATAVATHAGDDGTRFIVVRGAGDAYFAAGGDLIDLAEVRSKEATARMADEATSALDAVRRSRVPVIAYVNGDALGGGAELAVACDLRVFASHARIGYVHGRLAITPAWGGGADLVRLVGRGRALSMMARGEMIDASRALLWGLADAVVEGGADGADMRAFLEPLRNASPQLLRSLKGIVATPPDAAQRSVERQAFIDTWTHADHWAAVERFLNRGS
jgi:enoyl-CoA hydratase/carnithine racemase